MAERGYAQIESTDVLIQFFAGSMMVSFITIVSFVNFPIVTTKRRKLTTKDIYLYIYIFFFFTRFHSSFTFTVNFCERETENHAVCTFQQKYSRMASDGSRLQNRKPGQTRVRLGKF